MRTFLTRIAVIVAAVATAAAPTAGAAQAAPPVPRPTTSGSADFSVSGPAEPVVPDRDGVVHTELTVSNNGVHALTVTLRSIGVRPLDDGRVQLTDQSDPIWAAATTLPPRLELAADSYRRVPVTVRVPAGLLPDLYLLGFVAEAQPIDPDAPVRIYHRICTLITVKLDGARERALAAMVKSHGFLRIGSRFEGGFSIKNVGTAAAMARSQVLVTSALSSEGIGMVRTSDAMELVPSGTSRNVDFSYPVRGLLLYARPQVQVLYGNGTPTLQTITVQGRPMLVIPWLTLILIAAVVTMLVAYTVWRRRLRKARRKAAAARAAVAG